MSGFNQLPHASVWFMTAAVIVNDFILRGAKFMNFIGTTVSTGSLGWLELSGAHGYAVGLLRFFLRGSR